MRQAKKVEITRDERLVLQNLALANPNTDRISLRARIVLAAAEGYSNVEIAAAQGVRTQTISRWRSRFLKSRLQGVVAVKKSLGRRQTVRKQHFYRILHATQNEIPPNGRGWTCRSLASHLQLSSSLVQRVWKDAGVSPEWRHDYFAAPPFCSGDAIRLLGCFFYDGHRAIAVEVLSPHSVEEGNESSRHPITYTSLHANADRPARGRAYASRMLVDQQICFLSEMEKLASPLSHLRLITDCASSFSHPRVRRWIARSKRFSRHYSSKSRGFLAKAEASLSTLAGKRFTRSLSSNLVSLASQAERPAPFPALDLPFEASTILGGMSTPLCASVT